MRGMKRLWLLGATALLVTACGSAGSGVPATSVQSTTSPTSAAISATAVPALTPTSAAAPSLKPTLRVTSPAAPPQTTAPVVTRPAPTTRAAAPLCTTTSSGSCIRGGEFCPRADDGQRGTDVEGRTYLCEDKTHTGRDHWELS